MKKITSCLLALGGVALLASCGAQGGFTEGDTFTFDAVTTSKMGDQLDVSDFFAALNQAKSYVGDIDFTNITGDAGLTSYLTTNYGGIVIASHYTDPVDFYAWRWKTSQPNLIISGIMGDGNFADVYGNVKPYSYSPTVQHNYSYAAFGYSFEKLSKSEKKITGIFSIELGINI